MVAFSADFVVWVWPFGVGLLLPASYFVAGYLYRIICIKIDGCLEISDDLCVWFEIECLTAIARDEEKQKFRICWGDVEFRVVDRHANWEGQISHSCTIGPKSSIESHNNLIEDADSNAGKGSLIGSGQLRREGDSATLKHPQRDGIDDPIRIVNLVALGRNFD